MNKEKFTINLSHDEALCLFDFMEDMSSNKMLDGSVLQILMDRMICDLEVVLPDTFSEDYNSRVSIARQNLLKTYQK